MVQAALCFSSCHGSNAKFIDFCLFSNENENELMKNDNIFKKKVTVTHINYDICFHVSVCQNEGQSESLIAGTLNLRESLSQRAVMKH